jgi:hypothetical protein
MLKYGPVSSHFDFDSTGKRRGFIDLNHSDDRHAFSLIRLPVGIISGKPGPTLLITAGNHGDEYEGAGDLQSHHAGYITGTSDWPDYSVAGAESSCGACANPRITAG